MNRRDVKFLIIMGAVLALIVVIALLLNKKDQFHFTPTNLKDVEFVKISKVNKLNKTEKEEFKKEIIDYLNSVKYSYYNKVIFKATDDTDDTYYIYFYINNDDKSLIECAYDGSEYKFYFMGDAVDPYFESKKTGKVYKQIMNPKAYEKDTAPNDSYSKENAELEKEQKTKDAELEKIKEEAEKLPPDDKWN